LARINNKYFVDGCYGNQKSELTIRISYLTFKDSNLNQFLLFRIANRNHFFNLF